jgi:hypothetical protein
MANKMQLDDTRALRREQREARIARKRERREARAFKREHQTIELEALALQTIDIAPSRPAVEDPTPLAETAPLEAARSPVNTPTEPGVPHEPVPGPVAASSDGSPQPAHGGARRAGRRNRDIAEFLKRRDGKVDLARGEGKERIARLGEDDAVHDALMALAHPEASRWQQHRERLSQAIATRRIPEIGAAARRACRGAAADAARTSRRAPDPEAALTVARAYAVIAQAPWAAVRGRRAERSSPIPSAQRYPTGN